jgi:hypothetical protein
LEVVVISLCAAQIWVPDTLIRKEYKVIKVEDETVLLEVRGVQNGQEAWRAQKSMPISKFEARVDSWSLEVSAPAGRVSSKCLA